MKEAFSRRRLRAAGREGGVRAMCNCVRVTLQRRCGGVKTAWALHCNSAGALHCNSAGAAREQRGSCVKVA